MTRYCIGMRYFICLFLILTSCSKATDQIDTISSDRAYADNSIIRLSDSEATGLDPQIVSDLSSLRIAMDQYEGLVRFDANGEPIAGLARDWSVSPDGLAWRFTLRSDLQFSDETKITTQNFTQGFARLRDPKTASPHLALFDIIESIENAGDTEIIVKLKSPFPQVLELLAHPAMAALPMHAMDDDWTAMRPMIVSGPYRLTDWQLGDQMTLEANPHWHGQHGKAKKIIWKPMSDTLTAMRTFLSGAADTTSDVPVNRLQSLREEASESLKLGDYLGTYYYAFNVRKPPFDDVRVRTALTIAVDRDWIANKLIQSNNSPAYGLLPKQFTAGIAYRPKWSNWSKERRQQKARQLLKDSGYDANNPLRFEIGFNSSNEHRRVSVAMASMWREIGANVSLHNSEASLHFANLRRNDFELARSGWIADIAAPENFLYVHTKAAGASNYSGFDDPQYEAMLNAATQESDPKLRLQQMRAAEQYLMEQAPIIPLYHYVSRALVSPRLNGWRDNISNIHPSITLIETVK